MYYGKEREDLGYKRFLRSIFVTLLATVIPLAINGALSRFQKGHSTHAQRVWTITWLCFGALAPFLLLNMTRVALVVLSPITVRQELRRVRSALAIVLYLLFLVCAVPAIGGFVVVGQMLKSYGTCINVS
jgi:hypothetical protein